MSEPSRIPIDEITFQRLIYPREIKDSYNGEPFWYHVDRYQKALTVGHKMPPIVLARLDGKNILIDGYHRMLAYQRLNRTEIEATFIDVKDWNEAFLESVARNVVHGAPLGRWEMVRAANRLMTDGGYSAEQISFAVGMPQVELNRQVQQRIYIAPTTGEQIIVKRPVVGVKQQLPTEFSDESQSPLSTQYQSRLIDQVSSLIENNLLDTASATVRASIDRLNENLRNLLNPGRRRRRR
jgi:hypothetical protein